ncbi:MAG: TonB-dependent receptor, partial [Odoribacter sp.]|nr:TonB-dependent receptor [Odoribacter sp.]
QEKKRLTVKGVVKDESGETIVGASVFEEGNVTNGTVTDVNGNFTLTISPNATLTVSYIGYVNQKMVVKPEVTQYNIILKEDAQTLSEVVVVGYGTQKKVNLTGAVASVSTAEIKDRVQTDVLSAVQGAVPGVTIISRPGGNTEINFRGRGNLGTSEPLYVIDGVIATSSFFSNLDPNSIESISFLKDAASASIYGSRAAYGVVLVTTKQGKKEKTNVSYSGYVSFDNPTYKPEYVNSAQYAELYNEALYNTNPSAGKNQGYTEEEIAWFRDGSKPDLYPNTNWNDLILDKNVVTTQHSLNVSGGSEKIRYYAGLGYVYKDKMIPGQDMNRYNLNLNLNTDMTHWLTIKAGMKYIQKLDNRDCGAPNLANFSVVPSTYVARQSNGEWGTVNGGKLADSRFINYNPLRALSKNDWSKTKSENTMYDLGFDIKPVKGLVISGQGTYRSTEYKNKSYTALQSNAVNYFSGEEISGTGNTVNKMNMDWQSSSTMLYTATAKYDWSKGIHAFNVLLGTSYEHYKFEQLKAARQDFPSDGYTDISSGSTAGAGYSNDGSSSEYKMFSYFGRINYSLMDRYLLEVNLRSDASSRFHKNHRQGWFPSFSVGWRLNEEAFMKGIDWLDNLKLRASYGTLGNINNVGYYDYFQNYSSNVHYTFNDADVMGVTESKPANATLGWEKVTLTDLGIDFDLFAGKLSVTADYYIKKTSDILLAYNVPLETGISSNPSQNFGKVKNTGFELAINHRHHIGPVKYAIGANIATNRNRVVDMGTSNNKTSKTSYVIEYILREGHPVGSYYGYQANGLYTQAEIDAGHYYTLSGVVPNAGDIKFVPQREGVEWGAAITSDDRTIIGKDVPDFTYGVNLSLEWKGLEFSLFGQGVSGTEVAFDVYGIHPFYHGMDQPRKFHLKRWTEDNPNPYAAYPRIYSASSTHTTYNRNFNSYHLFDADYFRIKTLTLGYQIPQNIVNKWGLQALKVFVTGENLFTCRADSRMKDFDPESASGVIYNLGTKSVALGVNISF